MNSTGHSTTLNRRSLGLRSISIASSLSSVPDGPLPPLPTILPNRHNALQRRDSGFRLSVASTDTVGSSVLGTGMFSPHNGTPLTVPSPQSGKGRTELQRPGPRVCNWESSTVSMGMPPGKQTGHNYLEGSAGVGSLGGSIGISSLLRSRSTSQAPDQCHRESSSLHPVFNTIDANILEPNSSRRNFSRDSLSSSLRAQVSRTGSGYRKPNLVRRSMYDQRPGPGKLGFDPGVRQDSPREGNNPENIHLGRRPSSADSRGVFQWEQNTPWAGMDFSFKDCPESQRRGHGQEDCVQITNPPQVDVNRRSRRLSQMMGEDEIPETPTNRAMKIPGLALIEQVEEKSAALKPHQQCGKPSPSPFRNRPRLEPSSRMRGPLISQNSSTDSSPSPQPDSDVFNALAYDPKIPTMFTAPATGRGWPLAPTPPGSIKLNPISTPFKPIEPESPFLPSPPLEPAALFPRKSRVQGPRSLRLYSHRSRNGSPSPMVSRNSWESSGDDLCKSAMELRGKTSGTMSHDRVSKIYRNMANKYRLSSSTSDVSLSIVSQGGASVWEDASVRDSPEPGENEGVGDGGLQMPKSGPRVVYIEAYENARGQKTKRTGGEREGERERESRLRSPQGKGLGLVMSGSPIWGTPGSLYDGDGFLKDSD